MPIGQALYHCQVASGAAIVWRHRTERELQRG